MPGRSARPPHLQQKKGKRHDHGSQDNAGRSEYGDVGVDAADYVAWRDGLGSTHSPGEYEVWSANFGAARGNPAAAARAGAGALTTVPESASPTLAFLAGVTLRARYRR